MNISLSEYCDFAIFPFGSDGVQLLKDIKRLSPSTTVFVNLGLVDDEQEAVDEFMDCGAYKCYVSPVVMDTLFHDMYVALNLE